MSAANISQLPVKSLRWTLNLALSAFLTWTTLSYFIQPKELADALRRLGAGFRLTAFRMVLKSFKMRGLTIVNFSNPII